MFEGLPIRQWRQAETTIGPAANQSQQPLSKDDWPEPPLPRDSHLLPDHSQILLRAARAGRLYKLPTPPDEDEKEKGEEDEEAKETQTGYVTKKWAQVPRHQEEPEPEYLAKRRKGLPSAFSGNTSGNGQTVPSGPMRETKVKKTGADGSVHVYKVLVPEGQTVEGEVAEEDVEMKEAAPEEATPGTVVEGVGVVNAEGVVVAHQPTPPRRRPPPPRRKPKKGPGRGRKKVMFTPGEGANGTITNPDGTTQASDPNIKTEGTPAPGDTPMAEGGDDDGSSDGSEGEEDDDENREGSPTPAAATPLPKTEEQPTPAAAPAATESAPTSVPPEGESTPVATTEIPPAVPPAPPAAPEQIIPKKRRAGSGDRDPSSSPDLPLASAEKGNSRPTSAARQTRSPTPAAKKSATPPQPTETKEPATEEQQAPAPVIVPEQMTEQPQEPAKEKTPEKTPEKKVEEEVLQEILVPEQSVEQQPSPEKMEVDSAPQPEPEPPVPEPSQAAESEVDIFGSLEQQLENDGKN